MPKSDAPDLSNGPTETDSTVTSTEPQVSSDPKWTAGLGDIDLAAPTEVTSQAVLEETPGSQPASSQASRAMFAKLRSLDLKSFVKRLVEAVHAARAGWQKVSPRGRLSIFTVAILLLGVAVGAWIFGGTPPDSPTLVLERFARRVKGPLGEQARQALKNGDVVSALAGLRAREGYERLTADPVAEALRARLSLMTHDSQDALDWLEQALASSSELTREDWAASAAVQTFAANRSTRTRALLARLPKADVTRALRSACLDWQYRVRHGASELLNAQADACPDPVGFMVLDVWQLERCEQVKPLAKSLMGSSADPRVASVLEVVSRRPALTGCAADLKPQPVKPAP